MQSRHVSFALNHPCYDPVNDFKPEHFWIEERGVSVGLTCNIGMT